MFIFVRAASIAGVSKEFTEFQEIGATSQKTLAIFNVQSVASFLKRLEWRCQKAFLCFVIFIN